MSGFCGEAHRPLVYKAIEAQFGSVRTYPCMPTTCEYAFVTVRCCSPLSAGVDGKVTAKLVVLPYEILWFWFEPAAAGPPPAKGLRRQAPGDLLR